MNSPIGPTVGRQTRFELLSEHIRTPLYRNGYLLVASSVLSSGLGVVFWWLAARSFRPATVGVGSAAIAAMTLLANLASFNLVNGLNRFVPRAGQATSRLVGWAYVVAGVGSALAGLIYVAGLDLWSPSLGFLRANAGMVVWFALAVAGWALFVLQDGALTGLRAAGWVTIENLVYSVLKILVLLLFVDRVSDSSVFLAWTLPVVPLVIVVNVMLFTRLIPRHARRTERISEGVSRSMVSRFVLGDYSASLMWMGATSLLPIIVLERAGAAQAAYFYLAWTVAYVLYLVGRNFGMSMLTETARKPSEAYLLTFRTMRQTAIILAPAVIAVVALAPLALRLFGEDYSSEGADLLRLLSLAALPSIVTTAYVALLRAQRRMRAMLIFTSAMSVVVLPLSWVLLGSMGIVGVGIAWLAAHTMAALVLSVTELRSVFVTHMSPNLLRWLGRRRETIAQILGGRAATDTTRRILQKGLSEGRLDSSWEPLRVLGTVTDARAVAVGPDKSHEQAIVKFGVSELGSAALERSGNTLEALATDVRLAEWRHFAPELLGRGRIDGASYLIERVIHGVRGDLLLEAELEDRMMDEAFAASRNLTLLTRGEVGGAAGWFEQRINTIRTHLFQSELSDLASDLDDLAHVLASSLVSVPAAMTHGDYWLGNLMFDRDSLELVGILDWDAASSAGPADLDLVSLLMSSRVMANGGDTGPGVLALLAQEPWTDRERSLLAAAVEPRWAMGTDAIKVTWLHSVALLLEQSRRYQPGSPWFLRNFSSILPVLVQKEPPRS